MFWNRWSVAWLGVWLVGASMWAMFLLSVVIARWPAVPPAFSIYAAGCSWAGCACA